MRNFEQIIVTYPSDDIILYPEYKGKPYFSIQYEENGEHHIGYGTYNPQVLSNYIKDYFINIEEELETIKEKVKQRNIPSKRTCQNVYEVGVLDGRTTEKVEIMDIIEKEIAKLKRKKDIEYYAKSRSVMRRIAIQSESEELKGENNG